MPGPRGYGFRKVLDPHLTVARSANLHGKKKHPDGRLMHAVQSLSFHAFRSRSRSKCLVLGENGANAKESLFTFEAVLNRLPGTI